MKPNTVRLVLLMCLCVTPLFPAGMAASQESTYPYLEPFDCPGGYLAAYDPTCSYIVLPEDRADPAGGEVRIAVAQLPSRSANPEPDPVVYLVGGPGSHLIQTIADDGAGPMIDAWLRDRDVLLVDQRGIGLSQPSLACSELDTLTFPNEMSEDEAEGLIMDAVAACAARLSADGMNLATYTTVANADDVAEVPLALGYEQANFFGLSYGSQVVLQIMRRHPERVRTAVLEGVSPPDVNPLQEEGRSFEYALRQVIAACNEDAACSAAYPDLEALTFGVLAQLDAAPITYTLTDPATGEPVDNLFSARSLIQTFHQRLYYPVEAGMLPVVVYALAAQQYDFFSAFIDADQGQADAALHSTSGAHYAYWCGDYTLSVPESTLRDAIAELDPALHSFFEDVIDDDLQNCAQWPVTISATADQQPVVSDIPVLMLSGRFDPITPSTFAEHALETLSRAYHVVFPTMGHGIGSSSNRCGISIIQRFLADPLTEPNTSCLNHEPAIQFYIP